MVAVAVTALAGVAAAAALQAASAAGSRVTEGRRASDGEIRLRRLLSDALRHLPPAGLVEGPLLAVVPDSAGAALQFPSRGIVPPYGTGSPWRVTVRRQGDSLVVEAAPPPALGTPPRRAAIGGVQSHALRLYDGDGGGGWRADWPVPTRAPRAVEVAWRTAARDVAPVRVLLAPLGAGGTP